MVDITQLSDYSYEPKRDSSFLRLAKAGDQARIRIVSTPIKYTEISNFTGKEVEKFAWVVINRIVGPNGTVNEVKVFNTGPSVYWKIKELSQNADWGDPMTYDLVVARAEKNGVTSYSLTPSPANKGPINTAEQQLIAQAGINLVEFIKRVKGKNDTEVTGTKTFGQPGKTAAQPAPTQDMELKDIPF